VQPTADPLVGSRRWRSRLASIEAAAIAGVVCAIGWSLGMRGLLQTPAVDATDAEIMSFYADDNAGRYSVLWLQVIVVATIAFMWFVGVVRSRVGDREPRLFGTVFLGGAATAGGKGTIFGTFLAVILVGVLNNGMNLLGFNTFVQRIALGFLLVAAVAISQWRQARAERARTSIAAKS